MKKSYQKPTVQTISSKELIASLGPAQANPSSRTGGGGSAEDLTGFGGSGGDLNSR